VTDDPPALPPLTRGEYFIWSGAASGWTPVPESVWCEHYRNGTAYTRVDITYPDGIGQRRPGLAGPPLHS
jgi:hypothetical protein